MEIEEVINRIDGIKESFDSAFEKGVIDLDQITMELDAIVNELQSRELLSKSNNQWNHHLKTKKDEKYNKTIVIGDYK